MEFLIGFLVLWIAWRYLSGLQWGLRDLQKQFQKDAEEMQERLQDFREDRDRLTGQAAALAQAEARRQPPAKQDADEMDTGGRGAGRKGERE